MGRLCGCQHAASASWDSGARSQGRCWCHPPSDQDPDDVDDGVDVDDVGSGGGGAAARFFVLAAHEEKHLIDIAMDLWLVSDCVDGRRRASTGVDPERSLESRTLLNEPLSAVAHRPAIKGTGGANPTLKGPCAASSSRSLTTTTASSAQKRATAAKKRGSAKRCALWVMTGR